MITLFGDKKKKTLEPPPPAGACPRCGADKSARIASNGFGPTFKVLCGGCGHVFGEEVRK